MSLDEELKSELDRLWGKNGVPAILLAGRPRVMQALMDSLQVAFGYLVDEGLLVPVQRILATLKAVQGPNDPTQEAVTLSILMQFQDELDRLWGKRCVNELPFTKSESWAYGMPTIITNPKHHVLTPYLALLDCVRVLETTEHAPMLLPILTNLRKVPSR